LKILNIIQRYPPAVGGSEFWCRNICDFIGNKGVIVNVATISLYDIDEINKGLPQEETGVRLGPHDYEGNVFVNRYKLWTFWRKVPYVAFIRFLLFRLGLEKTEVGLIFKISPHSFEMYRRLFYAVREADIIHLHTLPYFHNLVGFYLAKLHRKRIVITPHFHPGHKHYEQKRWFKMMNACDSIIAVSRYEKEYLVGKNLDPEKIFVTGNTLFEESAYNSQILGSLRKELFEKHGVCERSKKILYLGRKETYKGIGFLIEAAEQLAATKNIDISLFLAGPASFEFENAYPDPGGSNGLKLLDFGYVSEEDKQVLLQACDVLVLPSQFEAFGIVFLEAWKYKKPVIGTRVGGIPEVIDGAGLCVEYGNVDDLKEKLNTILRDETLARRLGEAGEKKLKKMYSKEKIGNEIFNVYNKLKKYKKRILIVSQFFPPHSCGGSEIVAYKQAKMLKKMGFDVKILSGRLNNRAERHSIVRKKGEFNTTTINLHHKDFEHEVFANIDKSRIHEIFRKELYTTAPDIVHFHNIYALSIGIIDDCVKMHIPSAVTLHDYWGICFRNLLLDQDDRLCNRGTRGCLCCKSSLQLGDKSHINIDKRNSLVMELYNKLDLAISPSKYLAQQFIDRGLSEEKVRVINNGIDLSEFENIKKVRVRKIRFGYIGQIIKHKGIENLFKGISVLSDKEKKKISLTMVGTGDGLFYDYCKHLARQLKIDRLITFLGKIDNSKIRKIYEKVDMLVVPSIWPENSPVTIMEAFASGTPVLASDIGGIPELVDHSINGLLHKYDDPSSLADNIRKVIKGPEIVGLMSKPCIEKVKKYDLKKQVEKIVNEYKHITNCYD